LNLDSHSCPEFLRIPEFIDSSDCYHLCLEVSSARSVPSSIIKHNYEEVNEEVRRSRCVSLSEESKIFIWEMLNKLKPRLEGYFSVKLGLCEQPQFLMYREGDFFHVHQDVSESSESPLNIRNRQVSIVLFLNDQSIDHEPNTFGGGSLVLYDISEKMTWNTCRTFVSAKRGLLVAFSAKQFHQVTRIHHGERFTVVSWFPLLK
jgi:SM-20-related protein